MFDWRELFRRRQSREDDLEKELRTHLELEAEEQQQLGVGSAEARYAAQRAFGNTTLIREDVRALSALTPIENLFQDARYGLRQFRKSPGFTIVAVLTLALGIGATTAIFSVVYGALLRPLPFPLADQIVLIYEVLPGFNLNLPFNAPDFRAFSERQRAFDSLAIYSDQHYELSGDGAPVRIEAARTSVALFSVLGAKPLSGRTFNSDEDEPGRLVLVLSYGLWQRRYELDPNIVGRTVLLDRQPYTVIGVMPRNFQFPIRGERWNGDPAELWVPLGVYSLRIPGMGRGVQPYCTRADETRRHAH